VIVNGWNLYAYQLFDSQLQKLEDRVEALASKQPVQYKEQSAAKVLAAIHHLIFEIIPRDPNAAEFRQGNTLGPDNRHWFRAKFHQRFRLFYRFSSREKVIVYAWMSDELTLRKSGSKTDPYRVFGDLLRAGDPPATMEQLLARARILKD
jgi:toxin YhaV